MLGQVSSFAGSQWIERKSPESESELVQALYAYSNGLFSCQRGSQTETGWWRKINRQPLNEYSLEAGF